MMRDLRQAGRYLCIFAGAAVGGTACALILILLPAAVVVCIGALLVVVITMNQTTTLNAHQKHAAQLRLLIEKARPSLISRIWAELSDKRNWREQFVPDSEWWYGGSLIVVEAFDGKRLTYDARDGQGASDMAHNEWTRLVRA